MKTNKPKTPGFASDMLIAFGGKANVKTADDGTMKADGYLVRFSGPDDPDASSMRDFFTKSTYFGEAERVPVYFHHGLPIEVKSADGTIKRIGPGKVRIGKGTIKSDETGLFLDAVLDEAGEYQEAIQQLLDAGALGWSSGAVGHLVTREAVAGDDGKTKANNITQWLLAEGSLTHTPAEPRNVAAPVKTLLEQYGVSS
jgi:hypothetical protein